jgi:hypothetical protein
LAAGVVSRVSNCGGNLLSGRNLALPFYVQDKAFSIQIDTDFSCNRIIHWVTKHKSSFGVKIVNWIKSSANCEQTA